MSIPENFPVPARAVDAFVKAADECVDALWAEVERLSGCSFPKSQEIAIIGLPDGTRHATSRAIAAEVERLTRERDEARQHYDVLSNRFPPGTFGNEYVRVRGQRDRLAAALRDLARPNDEDENRPCWCELPNMVPYRGHDRGCEAARAVLAEVDRAP